MKKQTKTYVCTFVLILNCCTIAFAGSAVRDSILPTKNKEPLSFLLFTAGYKLPINNNIIINSGHGIYLETGINLAKFISDKSVLGIYGGYAFMDRLWSTAFNDNFSYDYSNSFKSDLNFSGFDSSVLAKSQDVIKNIKGRSNSMPGCEMRSWHNYSLYYGLQFKLPYDHFPIIKLYRGTTRTHFQGDGYLVTPEKEYTIFELRRVMHGCEVVILSSGLSSLCDKNAEEHNRLGLSLYYETCNFYNGSLYFDDGVNKRNFSLRSYTRSSFLNKYKNEVSFGVKLCFYLI